ncbi:RING finger protein [Gimesia chilikensis]|uniref:RING finger protein n=1 Tax=Gimesia chilikensis TaxID=2605989 RepID=UPI001189A29D|nr:RING finger protein [Gimesia chilikensis]QDT87297.1 hypothetical protein MalM14_49820 [Gimesia chilikensis]
MAENIVTCECGVKVRLPRQNRGSAFQCPKCKQPIALTSDLNVLFGQPLDTSQTTVCPICQTEIRQGENCVKCPDCDQIHHQECWSEIGGCGTYGCQQAPAVDDSEKSTQAPLTAWGDTKVCPACGETIKSIALKCRYCQTTFSSSDPMSLNDLKDQYDRSDETRTMRNCIIGLFAFSMVGILAPLALIISLIYILPKRDQLKQVGPVITVLAWVSIGLNVFYSFLLFIFMMFES